MNKCALLCGLLLTGCVVSKAQPRGGVVATGEPVAVVDDVVRWTTQYQAKVGETEYKDSEGHVIGTASRYENRTQEHSAKIWYPVQGGQQIRDEDFFRITGDQESLAATESLRADGRTNQRLGFIAIGGGFGVALVGYLIPNTTVQTILPLAGTVTALGGWYLARKGAEEQNPVHHAVDRSVADRAAQRYNETLGKTSMVGVSRQF